MQDRHVLLKSWIWQVYKEDKATTAKKLIKEFQIDTMLAMAELLKDELRTLKEAK